MIKKFWENNKEYVNTTLKVAWPAVLESFFVALVGLVDSLMVSRLGSYAVAATGLTTQPKFVGMCAFFALNMGVSAITARRKGQQDREGANRTFTAALIFTLVFGTIISLTAVFGSDTFMRWVGSNEETHDPASAYFKIIMGGIMFNLLTMVINAAQRGAGNTKISMRTNVVSNLVNVVFNFLLIEGRLGFPALGIEGAAIATVIGSAVSFIMAVISISYRSSFVSIHKMIKSGLPTKEDLKPLVKIGSTAFVEQIFMRIGFMLSAVMAANMGTDEYAAHQLGMNILSISFAFGDGMQVASITLIGQSLGRREPEIAKRYGNICQRMGNLISVVLSVIYLTLGRALYRLFFPDSTVAVDCGVIIMRLMVLIVLLQIAQVIYSGSLRGAGDVKFMTVASITSVTIIRPLSSYIFAYVLGLGITGIWIGIICDQLTRLVLASWRFKQGKWTEIRV